MHIVLKTELILYKKGVHKDLAYVKSDTILDYIFKAMNQWRKRYKLVQNIKHKDPR